jgi:hypothetical protein
MIINKPNIRKANTNDSDIAVRFSSGFRASTCINVPAQQNNLGDDNNMLTVITKNLYTAHTILTISVLGAFNA